jgi:hypothetical protein
VCVTACSCSRRPQPCSGWGSDGCKVQQLSVGTCIIFLSLSGQIAASSLCKTVGSHWGGRGGEGGGYILNRHLHFITITAWCIRGSRQESTRLGFGGSGTPRACKNYQVTIVKKGWVGERATSICPPNELLNTSTHTLLRPARPLLEAGRSFPATCLQGGT